MRVRVKADKEAGTLTVSDSGIGMTREEVEREFAFAPGENYLVTEINNHFTESVSVERFAALERNFSGMRNMGENATVAVNVLSDVFIPALLPVAGVSVAVILISLFACAWMLDKKVSL